MKKILQAIIITSILSLTGCTENIFNEIFEDTTNTEQNDDKESSEDTTNTEQNDDKESSEDKEDKRTTRP